MLTGPGNSLGKNIKLHEMKNNKKNMAFNISKKFYSHC